MSVSFLLERPDSHSTAASQCRLFDPLLGWKAANYRCFCAAVRRLAACSAPAGPDNVKGHEPIP